MSGAAAPAPPTLAAERPRAARERPLTAQRAHLAPSDRRQPPVRFREAPTMHTCSCAHAQSGHTHMHNILHTALPHASMHEQQQQLSISISSSNSDSGVDGDSDSRGITGNMH